MLMLGAIACSSEDQSADPYCYSHDVIRRGKSDDTCQHVIAPPNASVRLLGDTSNGSAAVDVPPQAHWELVSCYPDETIGQVQIAPCIE